MNKGAWLFALFAGGYILFEISMLHRLGYRMEADHILQQMVAAEETIKRCAHPTASQQAQFQKKLDRLLVRYRKERAQADASAEADAQPRPADTPERQVRAIRKATAEQIAKEGCDSAQAVTSLRRYPIYAGRD